MIASMWVNMDVAGQVDSVTAAFSGELRGTSLSLL